MPTASRIPVAARHHRRGEQHLDGSKRSCSRAAALYADGDFTHREFARAIMAIVSKVLDLNATDLLGIDFRGRVELRDHRPGRGRHRALAEQFQDDGRLTIYSAMIPSTTAMIGDVSYVINDPVAAKEMMKLVEAGEDQLGGFDGQRGHSRIRRQHR